jgi:hypothetical protein
MAAAHLCPRRDQVERMKRNRTRPTAPGCNWTGDGSRCKREAMPEKLMCEHHEWLMTQDRAWIDLLRHLGRLLAHEHVAEQTGLTREALRRLSR